VPDFTKQHHLIEIEPDESSAANWIRINDRVLLPKGFPKASQTIKNAGLRVLELDVSEFRKLDGGLSCLSLRF
jgi:dimethylargininase